MSIIRTCVLGVALSIVPLYATVFAQELVADTVKNHKAEVTQVISEEETVVPGTETSYTQQLLRVRFLAEDGRIVEVTNDYTPLEVGDKLYITETTDAIDGTTYLTVGEPYRVPFLVFLSALFVLVVGVFGGMQGLRGLFSLVASLFFIFAVLLPLTLAGYSPILVSLVAASSIVIVGSYVTHGFSRMTTTAVLGMIATIALTGIIASIAIAETMLTGFADDAALYLNFNTRGGIDLADLLLGGIIIGLLGVLYDAAIGQSVAVEELGRAGTHLSRYEIYRRALRIGREHIGALVNTLAIAYVGAALPLLLLFYTGDNSDIVSIVNKELFATEIVRVLVSSIGVVLVVPITTFIATRMLIKDNA